MPPLKSPKFCENNSPSRHSRFLSNSAERFVRRATRISIKGRFDPCRGGLMRSWGIGLKFMRAKKTALVFAFLLVPLADCAPDRSFHLMETSIADIHKAMQAGTLTCHNLVQQYLDRIRAYDQQGPAIKSMLYINPASLEQADALDQDFRRTHKLKSLGCIPIVLKDNFDTADMPTTAGALTLKGAQPEKDAFAVKRLREAGALILGKANLQEFASGGISVSSLGGQVKNPYDLTRTPGGSSGGTGAAIAANFAVIGTGSDTGQSIRSPASANNLVGIRPTRGLVSRQGVIPNSLTQDEVGPIARTVTDAALLLDVMVGYDAADPITVFGRGHIPTSYTHLLKKDALKGVRIGMMMNLFGLEDRHAEVDAVMKAAMAKMESLGADIIRFDLPEYDALLPALDTQPYEARAVMERYFAALGPDAPVKNFADLVPKQTYAVQK